jgi:hypothetical protein
MKREIPIHKKDTRTIGSLGLWTIDLASGTHKFGFQEDEHTKFARRKTQNREALERLAHGHSEGSHR